MKTAIYIEDGILQVVITPTTDFEQSVIKQIQNLDGNKVSIHSGSFYHCQGGFFRQGYPDDKSLIIKALKTEEGAKTE